jgi:ubiquitin-protein ligase E3 C
MSSFVEAAVYVLAVYLFFSHFLYIAYSSLEEQQLSKTDSHHPRVLSKRQIAAMSPRLGILNNIPFAIPFEVRVSIFQHFVMNDMMSRGNGRGFSRIMDFGGSNGREKIQVRRGMVAQDGFDRLGEVDLKAPIEISFIDQFGQEEYVFTFHYYFFRLSDFYLCIFCRAGIDGGGVFKEFFTSLCKEVFDTDRGLWLANVKHELYPNPHTYATECELPYFVLFPLGFQ